MSRAPRGAPFFLATFLAAAAAAAQTASGEPDPAAIFDEGVRLFQDGQYLVALERFRTAHSLRPHPITLENMARCHEALGDVVAALDAYEALAADPEAMRSRARRRETERAIARLRPRVGVLRITSPSAGTTIVLDGREIGAAPLPGPMRLAVGTHVVEARAPRYAPIRAEVEVRPGAEVQIVIDVGAAIPAPRAAPRLATIAVRAPRSVRIVVDGRRLDHSRRVAVGLHDVRASGPDGARFTGSVEVPESGIRGRARLDERLPWWPAATAAGVGLALGGAALFAWTNALDAESRYNDPATPVSDRAALRADALSAGRTTDVLVVATGAATAAALALGLLWAADRTEIEVSWREGAP